MASTMATSPAEARPLPVPSPLTLPFWEGTRAHKLLLQRCRKCGAFRWTPQYLCTGCHAEAYDWTETSGRGVIYAFTQVQRPASPAFKAPYVVAVVRLEEGPLMLTNIVGSAPDALAIGAPVEVRFEKASEDITLYLFQPVAPVKP